MSELRFAYQTQNIKIKLRNNAETRVSQCIFSDQKEDQILHKTRKENSNYH